MRVLTVLVYTYSTIPTLNSRWLHVDSIVFEAITLSTYLSVCSIIQCAKTPWVYDPSEIVVLHQRTEWLKILKKLSYSRMLAKTICDSNTFIVALMIDNEPAKIISDALHDTLSTVMFQISTNSFYQITVGDHFAYSLRLLPFCYSPEHGSHLAGL